MSLRDKITITPEACNELDVIESNLRNALIDLCVERCFKKDREAIDLADILSAAHELKVHQWTSTNL